MGNKLFRWVYVFIVAVTVGLALATILVGFQFGLVYALLAAGLSVFPVCSIVFLRFAVPAAGTDKPYVSLVSWLVVSVIFGLPWVLWLSAVAVTSVMASTAYDWRELLTLGSSVSAVHVGVVALLVLRGRRK